MPRLTNHSDSDYDKLREAIVRGEIAPNSRLVESDVVTSFNMSRGAVRNALIRLEQEGLVVREPHRGARTAFYGDAQLAWLERGLAASRATWKVIACEMPLSLVVRDRDPAGSEGWYEALANGRAGAPLGRELELARLLSFVRRRGVRNVVWIAADVHYACAIHYDPARARYQAFAPFWEFVSGPLNAGTFGPNALDDTFGPEVRFARTPEPGRLNLPPSAGMQFFGQVDIDGTSGEFRVQLKDIDGTALFTQVLIPG